MFPSALITFREVFEIVLVVGIMLTVLIQAGHYGLTRRVWQGVGTGVLLSLLAGYALHVFVGEFTGPSEAVFEGILLFITAGFLTWMILWVHAQEHAGGAFHREVAAHAERGFGAGIFFLACVSVLREGIETVLYLQAARLQGGANILWGGVLGLSFALVFGYIFFSRARMIRLSSLFKIFSIVLVLFAAGLVLHGVGEFQEAGVIPTFSSDPVMNLTAVLNEEGVLGSFLHTFVGYTSTPTALQLIAYGLYIVFVLAIERWRRKYVARTSTPQSAS